MKILGIIGTVFGSKTKTALNHIKFSDDVDYEIVDLADFNLQFADGRVFGEYDNATIELINKIMDADALLIGSPVYQASIPGSLKNLFDLFPVDTIKDKPVGIIITSGSNNHYLVAEYQLVPILNYLKADVINKYVYVTQEDFGVNTIVNEGIDIRLETLASELEARAKRYQELLASYDF